MVYLPPLGFIQALVVDKLQVINLDKDKLVILKQHMEVTDQKGMAVLAEAGMEAMHVRPEMEITQMLVVEVALDI